MTAPSSLVDTVPSPSLSNIINICLKFSKSSFEIDEARFPFAEFFAHLSQLAHLRQGGGASPGLGLLITKVLHIGHFFPLVAMVCSVVCYGYECCQKLGSVGGTCVPL